MSRPRLREDTLLSASRLYEHVLHRSPLVTPTGHQAIWGQRMAIGVSM